jgi:hypothetical protein
LELRCGKLLKAGAVVCRHGGGYGNLAWCRFCQGFVEAAKIADWSCTATKQPGQFLENSIAKLLSSFYIE